MQSLVEELARELRSVDWSQYRCACKFATNVPEMWDRLMTHGDPDWEFGNELCHQGTLYSAMFPLVSPLLKLARSDHPSRPAALEILAAAFRCTGGVLSYQRRLSQALYDKPLPNPFKPTHHIEAPPLPNEEEVAREEESIRQLRLRIESELPID